MLRDAPRTSTYHRAISSTPGLFEGKVVLDVGCGTGVLAMFAAKAGAKEVVGIDASPDITALARRIVKDNGLDDVVTIHTTSLEEWTPPEEGWKCDVIVSEWMGYFLVYEGMLDTVLTARDRYLRPTGVMYPDKAILYFFGYSDPYDDLAAFDDVCGLNFSAVKPLALLEPIVDFMNPRQVVTAPAPVLTLDLATAPVGSTKALTLDISLKLTSSVYPTGIGAYFEVGFTEATPPVGFSTAPNASATHWKQTLFPLHKQKGRGAVEAEGEGEEEGKGEGWKKGDLVKGEMRVKENERNRRDLDIELDCGGESYEFKLR